MKQFAIIGLGNFGYYLATHLYEKGNEVLAIDKNSAKIQDIRDKVSQAIVTDATDFNSLEAIDLRGMDAVIVCTGSALSNSILVTMNLLDLGIKNILAKALSEQHGRILKKLGVSEVFFPEKDMAFSMSERLNAANMLDYMPVMEGHSIIQIAPPAEFIGKNLVDLKLTNKYKVLIIAIKDVITEDLRYIPDRFETIKDSDLLFLLGPDNELERIRNL